MSSLFRHAFEAVKDADLVLEIVDARFASFMRNSDMEDFLRRRKIPFIIVLNKMDLLHGKNPASDEFKQSGIDSIPICCVPKKNINRLRSLLFSRLDKGGKIAVIGYPNTGKSSVINALSGRHAAPTSRQAGFTRGKSFVKLKEDVYLIDTPGVIPIDERDNFKLMLFNAKSVNQLKDIEQLAMELLEWLPTHNYWKDWLLRTYGLVVRGDGDEQLEQLSRAWNKMRRGGVPDTHATAIKLIQDWQQGISPREE